MTFSVYWDGVFGESQNDIVALGFVPSEEGVTYDVELCSTLSREQ